MERLEAFLQFDQRERLHIETLHNYSILHTRFSIQEIKAFYFCHCTEVLGFARERPGVEETTVAEVFARCESLLECLDDTFYCCVLANLFVVRNHLSAETIKCEYDLDRFNNFLAAQSDLDSMRRSVPTQRASRCVREGMVTPLMFSGDYRSIELTKSTFLHLVGNCADIPSLMTYDLNDLEIRVLTEALLKNPKLRQECSKFIEDQGITSTTMQIIASLCGICKKSKNVDYSRIQSTHCAKHSSKLYIPLSSFEGSDDVSQAKAYWMYLSNRTSIEDNLEDIIELLRSDACASTTGPPVEKSCESHTSLGLPNPFGMGEKSVFAKILDLVLKSGLKLDFDRDVFRFLSELSHEPYFSEVCRKYGRDIVDSGIVISGCPYLDEVRQIVEYAGLKSGQNSDRDSDDCSFDTLGSLALASSLESLCKKPRAIAGRVLALKQDEIKTPIPDLPIYDFREHPWMEETTANVLLECFIGKYGVNELASNFLCNFRFNNAINVFFRENCDGIRDKVTRGMVMCKLSASFGSFLLDEQQFRAPELRQIMERSATLFGLKDHIMTKKVPRKYIQKFLGHLTGVQQDALLEEMGTSRASTEFTVLFIRHLSEKYEFSHIRGVLVHLMNCGDIKVVREIQHLVLCVLNSTFVDESYLEILEFLYEKMLSHEDLRIKKNNDKILVLIARSCRMLGRETLLGNIRTTE